MTDHGSLIAGWHGKIPSLGDFASRRLPQNFIGAWDSWLQHAMATSRAHLGEKWLDLYLTSPIWRFALMPGICGTSLWAGVLMPSVDNVGRYFPLTIVVQLDPHPETMAAVFSAHDWYAALERLALAMLNINASLEDLERSLSENPFPSPQVNAPSSDARELATWWQTGSAGPKTLQLPTLSSLPNLFDAMARDLLTATGFSKSLWWTSMTESEMAQLHCFSGLPPEDYFAVLLEGIPPQKGRQ